MTEKEKKEKEKEKEEVKRKIPYKLEPPCLFEIASAKFDRERMDGYDYKEFGRYWAGAVEILVLDVLK